MSEGSEVSTVTLCVEILKWQWPTHSVTKVRYRAARAAKKYCRYVIYVIDHIKSDQKVYLLEHWINLLQIALDSKAFKLLFVNSFRRLDKGTKGTRAHLRRLVWKTILHNTWMYGEYLQKTMFITFIFTLVQICICLFVFFSHVVFTKYCCKLSQLIWINLNPHINTFALPKGLDISVHPYESGGNICILWYWIPPLAENTDARWTWIFLWRSKVVKHLSPHWGRP